VIGGAIAGVAKEELAAKAGIDARTVASYLHHWDKSLVDRLKTRVRHDLKQLVRAALGKSTHLPNIIAFDAKSVLIVDEAGMLDTKTTHQLCRIVRERGGTIVLVGDAKQLPAIGPGGPFAHLLDRQDAARLTTNIRQHDAEDRKAAALLRRGEAKPALDSYAQRGRLVVAKDREQAIRELVATWVKHGGCNQPEQHVAFTPTRAEAQLVNRLVQAERDSAGEIDRTRSLRNGDDVICRGDRVLFHKNIFADGVRNGYRGIVTQVDRFRGTLAIRLDGDEARNVTIRLRNYGPEGLSLGYAMTTHKGQGQSVEHAYLLVGGKMSDRELTYVQATRGKRSTRLFVDDVHAGEELKDLARALSRTRAKELAHDQAARAKLSPDLALTHERRM
jgi:ATP-dependent exoDNAse (exonuclease V) alpha subunit